MIWQIGYLFAPDLFHDLFQLSFEHGHGVVSPLPA